uniref:Uncharacterized protein n=1 Tax=Lygus hesperus TaxID=30085 RepID=A0A0A9YHU8_LYGHE
MCMMKNDGNMETCSSCASLLSSKNEVKEPVQLTLLGEDIKKDIDNVENVSFSEPQAAADKNQNDDVQEPSPESETQILPGDDEDRKNPSDFLVLQDVSSTSENQNSEEDGGYEGEPNSPLFFDEQPSQDDDIEEEVIEIKGDRFEVIIQEVDDDSGNDDEYEDTGIAEPEVTIPEVVEGFAQQLSNLDEECIEEQLRKEEVIFVETYKSESWPFSFSLPSLDKFHKKSTDSAFKWPPLPSSIIVKPRKESTCTCVESNNPNDNKENGDQDLQTEPQKFEACTCGHPRDRCKCKAQDDT